MIDTRLHNLLVDQEIEYKLNQTNQVQQKIKNLLLLDKIKYYLSITVAIFLVVLMIVILTKLIMFDFNSIGKETAPQIVQCECSDSNDFQKITTEPLPLASQRDTKSAISNQDTQKKSNKDGIEYVKENNMIVKKEWKEGVLIHKELLKPTIEESRKELNESIPQFATQLQE